MNHDALPRVWLETTLWIFAVTTLLVVGCGIAQRLFVQPLWRRTLWQGCQVSLLALVLLELTGLGPGATRWLSASSQATSERTPTVATATKPTAPRIDPVFLATVNERAATLERRTGQGLAVVPTPPAHATGGKILWWLGIWIVGTLVVLGRLAVAKFLLWWVSRRCEPVECESLRKELRTLALRLNWSRPVRLLRGRSEDGPYAFGLWRPTIVLPRDFETRFTPAWRTTALLHELTHLAGRDPFWYMLTDVVSSLLWWQPLIWWSRRQLHLSSEMTADTATVLVPEGPASLAECLIDLSRRQPTRTRLWQLGVAGSNFKSSLGQRVQQILELTPGKWSGATRRRRAVLRGAIILSSAVVLLGGSAWARPERFNTQPQTSMHTLISSVKSSAMVMTLFAAGLSAQPAEPPAGTPPVGKFPPVTPVVAPSGLPGAPAPSAGLHQADETQPGALRRGSSGAIPGSGRVEPLINPSKYERKRELQARLDSIVLPEVMYDNLPLGEVVRTLIDESRKAKGPSNAINFLLVNGPLATIIDPATGLPVPQEPFDLSSVTIRLQPPLKNVRLSDVLEAIVKVADRPIRYTLEDYGVVITSAAPAPADKTLEVRTYRVEPDSFLVSLQTVFGLEQADRSSMAMVRDFLRELGVNLEPPRMAFYNDRLGILMVRVNQSDVSLITAAIETLGGEQTERTSPAAGSGAGGGFGGVTIHRSPQGVNGGVTITTPPQKF